MARVKTVLSRTSAPRTMRKAFQLLDYYNSEARYMPLVQKTLVLAELEDNGLVSVVFDSKEMAILRAFRGETKSLWTRVGVDLMRDIELKVYGKAGG